MPLVDCEILLQEYVGDGGESFNSVRFCCHDCGVTAGQVMAVYVSDRGEVCLGGGIMGERGLSYHERGSRLLSIMQNLAVKQ
mmetsp:Transcript_36089/g.44168  ORF Transcript_36089/g.44168 Transcript_36089/m.44168 type:complete len:82 (+) Transcript_36089:172-417(+)